MYCTITTNSVDTNLIYYSGEDHDDDDDHHHICLICLCENK